MAVTSELLERKRATSAQAGSSSAPPLLDRFKELLVPSAETKHAKELDANLQRALPSDPGAVYRSVGALLKYTALQLKNDQARSSCSHSLNATLRCNNAQLAGAPIWPAPGGVHGVHPAVLWRRQRRRAAPGRASPAREAPSRGARLLRYHQSQLPSAMIASITNCGPDLSTVVDSLAHTHRALLEAHVTLAHPESSRQAMVAVEDALFQNIYGIIFPLYQAQYYDQDRRLGEIMLRMADWTPAAFGIKPQFCLLPQEEEELEPEETPPPYDIAIAAFGHFADAETPADKARVVGTCIANVKRVGF